jgi:hypothetical protein
MAERRPNVYTPYPTGTLHSTDPAKSDDSVQGSWLRRFLGNVKSMMVNGIIPGIVSGLIVSFSFTPTGHATGIFFFDGDPTPSCDNPQWLLQVPDDQISANPAFEAVDKFQYYGIVHTADYTIDGSVRTAWLQWWPIYGFKAKSYISWSFQQRYDVRLLCIVDGWTADSYTYDSTMPIKTAAVVASGCSDVPVRFRHLGYAHTWQPVELSCGKIGTVFLYPGSAYSLSGQMDRDSPYCVPEPKPYQYKCEPLMGISEVRIYYSPGALDIFTRFIHALTPRLLSWTANGR